jgi:hypothetical protein
MTYPVLLAVAAVDGLLFGLLFLLLPDTAISVFGGQLDPLGALLVRQLGGVITGLGLLNWLIRKVGDGDVRSAVIVGNVTAFAVIAVTAAIGAASGIINILGWGVSAFHAMVAIGLVMTQVWSSSSGLARAPNR